jgi:aminopeptidase YwaD
MNVGTPSQKCKSYLEILCQEISERCVGSEGNRRATRFFEERMSSWGWAIEQQTFDAIDWISGEATLESGEQSFEVFASPYSLGCDVEAALVAVSTVDELAGTDVTGKLLLLHGEIAKEQLMPKNFVFFNPERHRRIISLLEAKEPQAIITATGRNAALAGGVYPFPLIEDGDFDIPSVYMTEEEGRDLVDRVGGVAHLRSISQRVPGEGENIVARKGTDPTKRIVVTAHIDAKKGSPGAIDNATGVVVLLLLAEHLRNYQGHPTVEIVAFNGEDYYAVPGQMLYLRKNQDCLGEILLNINIDGVGYREGPSTFSFFDLPAEIRETADIVLRDYDGIIKGAPWFQGDHSIFVQQGIPALAVTSSWFLEHMESQTITHTAKDNMDVVTCERVVEVASALRDFIKGLSKVG